MTTSLTYKIFFDNYLKSFSKTTIDIRFWKYFLNISIEKYKIDNPVNTWINQAGYSVYNIQPDGLNTWLHLSDETYEIKIRELNVHCDNFFIWVMNLSIIRLYNSVELLLLQSIQYAYFHACENPAKGKKQANKIIAEVKNSLISKGESSDSTNNRHLILFLKTESTGFESFMEVKINPEWNTTWREFYEFISVLRNVIAHDGMMLNKNVRNNLNSIAGDAFKHYFPSATQEKIPEILKPEGDLFLNLLGQINDFAINSIKYIAKEEDFRFLGLYSA